MTQPSTQKSPAQRVLDLAVYGPLGLALSIAEALPAMARKGRSRLAPQMGLARTVGQLAVQQGYRQLRDKAASGTVIPFRPPVPVVTGRAGAGRAGAGRAGAGPAAADLAIPSYDSLSAPQVVQRLAGLSDDEVAAVRAYEAATRGRRTILGRAEQLLG
jgi:hypothetical protein